MKRIDELGGEDAYPVVPLELVFDGNDDPASIGPNLDPHPGVRTFERVLVEIRERRDVSDVVLQIDEVLGPDEWPLVSAAYVITTASPEEVHRWAAVLQPDELADDEVGPWLGRGTPPGAPEIPERAVARIEPSLSPRAAVRCQAPDTARSDRDAERQ